MATTKIVVIDEVTGKRIEGVKVSLELSGGFCGPEWTDYSGEATINHTSTGKAGLYIDGNYMYDINTPGYRTVRINRY